MQHHHADKKSQQFYLSSRKVWVVGHKGMVGSAIVRCLDKTEDCDIMTTTRAETDLTCQSSADRWICKNRPDVVFLAAAKVGGIYANTTYPADFIYQNLMIEANVIKAAHKYHVKKLLFLGSNCIYPSAASQPIKEEYLLTGTLEKSNEWYAIAKIAGIKLCQAFNIQYGCDYIVGMPVNLYGPGDNFHPKNSHLPAGLLSRFHAAKKSKSDTSVVWGSGKPRREFMHVDDLADACIYLMKNYTGDEPVNIGCGKDITISEFAHHVADVVGFTGKIIFDPTKPDGVFQKLLDTSRINGLGWFPEITLDTGLKQYYAWYVKNQTGCRFSADDASAGDSPDRDKIDNGHDCLA